MRHQLFQIVGLFVFFVFVANTLGSFFGWYVLIPWYDNMMHFFGGAWLALVASWLSYHHIQEGTQTIVHILLFVLIGALLWEGLEYAVQFITKSPHSLATIPDSISDIIFGLLGGAVAGWWTRKKIQTR